MQKKRMIFLETLMIAAVFALALTGVAMADDVTIMGEVNDQYQVVGANGQIYEVAENDAGDDLILNYIGKKVMVTGTLSQTQDEEAQILLVKEFKVMQGPEGNGLEGKAKQETGARQ
jgi:hypothetical protein